MRSLADTDNIAPVVPAAYARNTPAHGEKHMNRRSRMAWMGACAAAVLAVSGLATGQQPAAAGGQPAGLPMRGAIPTVTATGSAVVSSAPDQAIITMGAAATAKTSTEAQAELNRILDAVVKAVRAIESPGMQVQTQWISLQPVYERPNYRDPEAEQREPRILGYRASNTVRVTLNQVERAGAVIDAAIAAGANQIAGISFGMQDDRPLREEAMRSAAQDARRKADAMAAALGLRVVRVLAVHSGDVAPPIPLYESGVMMRAAADVAAPTVVEAGEVTVQERVTVVVEVEG